jgi:hypothetical protein
VIALITFLGFLDLVLEKLFLYSMPCDELRKYMIQLMKLNLEKTLMKLLELFLKIYRSRYSAVSREKHMKSSSNEENLPSSLRN